MRSGRKPVQWSVPTAATGVGVLVGAALLAGIGTGAALAQPAQPAATSAPPPGEALAFDRSKGNCLTCHDIKGGDAPGNVGPPLADMKSRYPDRKELTAIIFDETKRNPMTVMPPFGRNLILTKQEIESVVDFLYTR
ncbi:MAG: sulfur oxidation c-type cytochrome SoxX [Xanthobacteraceae bacterium]